MSRILSARRDPASRPPERWLWVASLAFALAVHGVGGALLSGAGRSREGEKPWRVRPLAVWGYLPATAPEPVPPGLGVPEAAGAERGRGPVRDFSLERPRVEPPVLPPIATEPLLEPTGEITPAAAVSEEFIRQAADAAPPPPELAVHGDELVGPDLLRETRREPRYPEAARRLRIEASVLLQVLVREDGTVGEVSVLRCTRPKIGFEEAALEAVREWRFRPASLRGRPVPATVTVKVDFVP